MDNNTNNYYYFNTTKLIEDINEVNEKIKKENDASKRMELYNKQLEQAMKMSMLNCNGRAYRSMFPW